MPLSSQHNSPLLSALHYSLTSILSSPLSFYLSSPFLSPHLTCKNALNLRLRYVIASQLCSYSLPLYSLLFPSQLSSLLASTFTSPYPLSRCLLPHLTSPYRSPRLAPCPPTRCIPRLNSPLAYRLSLIAFVLSRPASRLTLGRIFSPLLSFHALPLSSRNALSDISFGRSPTFPHMHQI
jgi:hypothetical protein